MLGYFIVVGYLTGMVICGGVTMNRDRLLAEDSYVDAVPHVGLSIIWPLLVPAFILAFLMRQVAYFLKYGYKCKF